jgi:hypothetical protein
MSVAPLDAAGHRVDGPAPADAKSWRDILPVHPAADLFPLLSDAELLELGNDIRANGLHVPIVAWKEEKHFPPVLLDGRNRLSAMEKVGAIFRSKPVETAAGPYVAAIGNVAG